MPEPESIPKVFLCYAREDNDKADPLRGPWLDRLRLQLKRYEGVKAFKVFADVDLEAGDAWNAEIRSRLEHAAIVVVLVSDALLASDYVREKEMPIILARAARGELKVVPVILNHCGPGEIAFEFTDAEGNRRESHLTDFQTMGSPELPLLDLTPPEQSKLLSKIAETVCRHAQEATRKGKPVPRSPLAKAAPAPEPVVAVPSPTPPRPPGQTPKLLAGRGEHGLPSAPASEDRITLTYDPRLPSHRRVAAAGGIVAIVLALGIGLRSCGGKSGETGKGDSIQADKSTGAVVALGPPESNRLTGATSAPDAQKALTVESPRTTAATLVSHTNSLGMVFVPVPDTEVLFSVWETRVQDFEAFVRASGYNAVGGMYSLKDGKVGQFGDSWSAPGFAQGATYPVCGVSWEDAQAFCRWLSKKEGRVYRLPTDEEWSRAVGLPSEGGATPKERHQKIADQFPWGTAFPPPADAGNYRGSEVLGVDWPQGWGTIDGYSDGYARTSPSGSFSANNAGLFDLGGNVSEWCQDWRDSDQEERVLRGGSWLIGNPRELWSSNRSGNSPTDRSPHVGFRVVLASAL